MILQLIQVSKDKQMKLGEEVRNGKKLKEEEGRNELKEEEEKPGYVAETKNKKQTWLLGKVLLRRRRK